MLSVEDALQLVLSTARPLAPRRVQPCDALGHLLAEPIVSDIDSPPHDKSMVDGYAVIAADVGQSGSELQVLEEVTAGAVPTRPVEPGTATRIMTGAPIPPGADAVVMVEQTSVCLKMSGVPGVERSEPPVTGVGKQRVRIDAPVVKAGQNIMRRAAALSRGQTVLQPGHAIRAIELGLLAEVGVQQVPVVGWPSVAVLSTGNELVEASETPGPGQIRNSNGPLLKALATQAGADAWELRRARDTEEDLADRIQLGLHHDVLLITGGVSAGVLDLVPGVLTKLGVEQVFHKVNLKPGKPLWFGVKRVSENGKPCLVFGLPGNPVSSLVCFELFARAALQRLSGREPAGLPRFKARLTQSHQQRGDRPTYWPAKITHDDRPSAVTPLAWRGSGDLRTLAEADGLACFPSGERLFEAGDEIEVLQFVTR